MSDGLGAAPAPPEHLQDVLAGAPLLSVVPVTKDDIIAIGTAGYQFLEQGQQEKARNAFSALIKLAPRMCIGYAGLGAVALAERSLGEALELLAKAVTIYRGDANICANLGEVMLRLGQPDEAKVLLNCAVKLDPDGRHPAANRARAMLAGIEERGSEETESEETGSEEAGSEEADNQDDDKEADGEAGHN